MLIPMESFHRLTDEQLMAYVAKGDRRAFDWLVRQHLPRAYAIARRVLMNQADAEEAAQDAFTKLWVHAADWQEGKAKFTTWMYRIVVNASLDLARKRKLPTTSDETILHAQADGDDSAEDRVMQHEEHVALQAALAHLTPAQRTAVSLCYFEELTNPEAARAMGLNVKALEGLLVRARKQLRGLLSKEGGQRHAA
ncbi:MAG: hypothetical protein DI582_05705 [Azospirillum brasilense]|nr:MAG: hypothetical protein DI582_05705 [Azospirillum brasilense]